MVFGIFFPLLFGRMKIETDCYCDSRKYFKQYMNNISVSLEKDIKKLEQNYGDMLFICKTFINDLKKKTELDLYMNKVDKIKAIFKLKLIDEIELKEKQKQYEKEINLDNFKDKLATAIRSMKKRIFKLPKKNMNLIRWKRNQNERKIN